MTEQELREALAHLRMYWAARLFNQAETIWNKRCVDYLRSRGINVEAPQERAEMFRQANGGYDLHPLVMDCGEQAMALEIVVVNLDGLGVDDGASLEAGMAIGFRCGSGRDSLIIGARTDFRGMSEDSTTGVNGMFQWLDGIITATVEETPEILCDRIFDRVVEYVESRLARYES